MEKRSKAFKSMDMLYLAMIILPVVCAVALKVLTQPPSDGIEITGALIYFVIDMPIQKLYITEAQINSWLVLISLFGLCLFLTHGLDVRNTTYRQRVAEWIVEKTESLVKDNMGEYFKGFAPFIGAIMALSAFSSLLSLFGLFPPTSDLNIVAGWAIVVFILITYYKMKCGPLNYLKSFCEPVALLAPINVVSEIATPISMSFRHYGNILSGTVISTLLAAGLTGLSQFVLGWIPVIGDLALLRIGLPAILSIYFDVFSGCLQAFIFAMLTMVYVSGGFDMDLYFRKHPEKADDYEEYIGDYGDYSETYEDYIDSY